MMLVVRVLNSWLYILIGGSFMLSLIMITRGLDKYGKLTTLAAPHPVASVEALPHLHPVTSVEALPYLHPVAGVEAFPRLRPVAGVEALPRLHPVASAEALPHLHPVASAEALPRLHPVASVEEPLDPLARHQTKDSPAPSHANPAIEQTIPSRGIHHISPGPPKPKVSSDDQATRMEDAINREREAINKDLKNYEFPGGGGLSDLVSEQGGQPVRAMVVTTWRSGSTFIGDIMDSHPATYYHYEPLLHFEIRQAREGHLAEEAIRTLIALMKCDYSDLNTYLKYGKTHFWLFKHNKRLWKYCTEQGPKFQNSYCWKPEFLNRFCSLFPFQSIKTVRLRLNLTRQFIQDTELNVKILLLVRDPRGTMQSRKHRDWCPGNPDCEDPSKLCEDLKSDYYAAQQLLKLYPDRYRVVRYEDFSLEAHNNSVDLFKFFGYSMHSQVKAFLDSHTTTNIGGVSSTFRDSKTAPFKWRESLTTDEVFKIQNSCSEAMALWGYRILNEDDKLSEFSPVIGAELIKDLGNILDPPP